DLVGGDPGHFHCAQRGLGRHVRRELILGRDPPLLDAGARRDPFIRGLDHFFQFRVGEDFFRHIRTDPGNGAGANLAVLRRARFFLFWSHFVGGAGNLASASAAFAREISRAMVWLTWWCKAATVTRRALVTARSRAEACALKTMPLKPSSGAPP